MMTDDTRLKVDRWLDDDLSVADEATLQQALEGEPGTLAHLADRALLHGLLRESGDRAAVVAVSMQPRRRFDRRVACGVAAVLACIIVGGIVSLRPATASPTAVVRKALEACGTLVDRRYAVRIEPTGTGRRGFTVRPQSPRDSTLWVRGTRFVQMAEVPGRTLVWGRDARGAVWFAVSRRSVAVFEADEIPESLRDLCDLRTLDLETLLTSLLKDFECERIGSTSGVDTILARPRAGTASRVGPVEIEIDEDSLLVTNVVLERRHHDWAVGRVRFELEETSIGQESLYEWPDHVDSDADVRDRGAVPGARRELLGEFLRLLRRDAMER